MGGLVEIVEFPVNLAWGDVDCSGGSANGVDFIKIELFLADLFVSQEDGCPLIGDDITFAP